MRCKHDNQHVCRSEKSPSFDDLASVRFTCMGPSKCYIIFFSSGN